MRFLLHLWLALLGAVIVSVGVAVLCYSVARAVAPLFP